MKKSLISIPNPCDQAWGEMSPNKLGAFCASCSTTVVDFASMSGDEITRFLDKSQEPVCGRFNPEQLQSNIQTPISNNQWSLNLRAVVLGASLLTFQPAFASQIDAQPLPNNNISILLEDSIQMNVMRFILLDSVTGEPIPNLKVSLYGINGNKLDGVYSDIDGKGMIYLRDIDQTQIEKIVVEGALYKTQEVLWADINFSFNPPIVKT